MGASGDEVTAEVLGRVLGARDLALGLGTHAAVGKTPGGPWPVGALYAAGALSDSLDVVITVASWRRLKFTRWLVAAASAGAATAGAADALATVLEEKPPGQ